MELSTYFRINAANTGQFERTLIVADEGAYVSYLEGCTAPMRDENQLHAAVVELVALDDAEIKYSTVQNWYPGDKETARAASSTSSPSAASARATARRSRGPRSRPARPSPGSTRACILKGDDSVGEFYSVALTDSHQQADTGTKMIHLGKNTRARSSPRASRPAAARTPTAAWSRSAKSADERAQLLAVRLDADRRPLRRPHLPLHRGREPDRPDGARGHTSKIGEDQIFYCNQRGIETEDAVSMIVNGFCKEVFRELPMEFAVEAQKLLGVSLEGSVG